MINLLKFSLWGLLVTLLAAGIAFSQSPVTSYYQVITDSDARYSTLNPKPQFDSVLMVFVNISDLKTNQVELEIAGTNLAAADKSVVDVIYGYDQQVKKGNWYHYIRPLLPFDPLKPVTITGVKATGFVATTAVNSVLVP